MSSEAEKPEACPKCGADREDRDRFACGTWNCVDDDRKPVLVESELCKSRHAFASLTAQLAERDREIEKLEEGNPILGKCVRRFMDGALFAIAGAVTTPEKGYWEDGGLDQLLCDIRQLRKQHDGMLDARVRIAVLERENERLREGIEEVKAYCDCQAPLWGEDGGSAFTLVYHRLCALAAQEGAQG